jgi:NAD(P)-dependent dehydrogenase (short-subunit alcohol dehydrogenase family)
MPAASERTTTWPEAGTGSATSPTTNRPPLVTAARIAEPPPADGAAARIHRYVCPVSFTHDAAARPFAGHVALVTGAARPRGIGRATAVALARGGADVACLDIARPYTDAPHHGTASGGDLEALASELAEHDVRAMTVQADVSDEAAVEAAVARVGAALGTVTLVANVAGGSGLGFGAGPLLGVPADEFRRVLDVNLIGTWLVSKACATRMVAAGVGGRICNVSSQAGKRPFTFLGPYCAAKAGVILLTQTMALELGPSGIAVNAVCPGTVDTDLLNKDKMFENMMGGPEGLAAYVAREIPLGRMQDAEEIAAAICWLLSDAARGVTGEALNVSAGQTMV